MNAAAGQTVNLVEGGHSLPLSIYDMVAPVGKTLEQGGKAMAARIRRAVVAVALALLMATALAGIEVADGQHDLIDCGPGEFDRVSVDELDVIGRCEIVTGNPARTTTRF